jgi:MoaA/NifB/PqqE/SkfB family radical SAM enzyme
LTQLCRTIWSETNLGISITTHGQRLSEQLVDALEGSVSIIRVSIDAPEPYYSSVRQYPLRQVLDNLRLLSGRIPLGINTVVNSNTLPSIDELGAEVKNIGAVDWLLLPEVRDSLFTLTQVEWRALDAWIVEHQSQFELRVTAEASAFLSGPFLFEDRAEDYAHISADGHLRRCSYARGGVHIGRRSVVSALRALRQEDRSHVVSAARQTAHLSASVPGDDES